MKVLLLAAIIACLFFSSNTANTVIFDGWIAIDPNLYGNYAFPATVPKSTKVTLMPPGSQMGFCMSRIIQKALLRIPEFGKITPPPTFDIVQPSVTQRIQYTLISNGPHWKATIIGHCDFQTITAYIDTATFVKF